MTERTDLFTWVLFKKLSRLFGRWMNRAQCDQRHELIQKSPFEFQSANFHKLWQPPSPHQVTKVIWHMLVFIYVPLSDSGCNAELGGFAGLFDLKAAGFVDPILVAGTDGVGTKLKVLTVFLNPVCSLFSEIKENNDKKKTKKNLSLSNKIAQTCNIHNTLGQDLVAMCVNDVLAQGAEPLFFLDYFSCGKLDVGVASTVIGGIAEACQMAGCALLGEHCSCYVYFTDKKIEGHPNHHVFGISTVTMTRMKCSLKVTEWLFMAHFIHCRLVYFVFRW